MSEREGGDGVADEQMGAPPTTPVDEPAREPRGWDLEWQAEHYAGRPERYPPSLDAVYAEHPVRAVAFGLDILLVSFAFQVLTQARGLVSLWVTRDNPAAENDAVVISSTVLLVALVLLTLTAVYFWRVFRATPGQLVLGLFVVERGRGRRLSRGRAFVRWLVLYAPLVLVLGYTQLIDVLFRSRLLTGGDPLLIASVAYFAPLVWYAVLAVSALAEGRRGRGLHDRLAGSVVIRRAGPPT